MRGRLRYYTDPAKRRIHTLPVGAGGQSDNEACCHALQHAPRFVVRQKPTTSHRRRPAKARAVRGARGDTPGIADPSEPAQDVEPQGAPKVRANGDGPAEHFTSRAPREA